MAKVTDLEAIKDEVISLLYEPITYDGHPVFDLDGFYEILPNGDEVYYDVFDEADLEDAIAIEENLIDKATTAIAVVSHVNDTYLPEFLKTIEQYISEEDVAEIKSVLGWIS